MKRFFLILTLFTNICFANSVIAEEDIAAQESGSSIRTTGIFDCMGICVSGGESAGDNTKKVCTHISVGYLNHSIDSQNAEHLTLAEYNGGHDEGRPGQEIIAKIKKTFEDTFPNSVIHNVYIFGNYPFYGAVFGSSSYDLVDDQIYSAIDSDFSPDVYTHLYLWNPHNKPVDQQLAIGELTDDGFTFGASQI